MINYFNRCPDSDIYFIPEGTMIAALFDCDGTLTKTQFGRGLLQYVSENGRKNLARQYYAFLFIPFMLNKLGLYPDESLLRIVVSRLTLLLKGLDRSGVDEVFDWSAHQYLLGSRREDIIMRLQDHRAKGHQVIIVSAQYLPNLEKIGEALGVDDIVGTSIEMQSGRWRVVPPVVTGKDKRNQTLKYVQDRGWDIDWKNSYAYADSFTDMDLFRMVGNPVAVYPDEKLQEFARREGWATIGETEKN